MGLFDLLGGAFTHSPDEMRAPDGGLSPAAIALVEACFADVRALGRGPCVDYHTHVVGLGTGGTGALVSDILRQPLRHPLNRIKFKVFMSASGVEHESRADQEYAERLVNLAASIRTCFGADVWGQHNLLGMSHFHQPDTGELVESNTGIFTPNSYVVDLCRQFPHLFRFSPSIHPGAPDAIDQLRHFHRLCATQRQQQLIIKWLPNSMGIDPSAPICDPFYETCRELGIVILSHVGKENAVDTPGIDQTLGNPLLLRRALDAGVRVIAAHCASEGSNVDLDDPRRRVVSNFDLLLRLLDDPRYKDLLFADISSMTLFRRLGKPLTTMLNRTDLHGRLVNGSDYPVIAVNFVLQTRALVGHGYITAAERTILNEIYGYNPLLFDYCVKRTLRSPDTGSRFAPSVFVQNDALNLRS